MRIVKLKRSWKTHPLGGDATATRIRLSWLVWLGCLLYVERALQVLQHEMTHVLGEEHHPDDHGCAMVAHRAKTTQLHLLVTPERAFRFAQDLVWTVDG